MVVQTLMALARTLAPPRALAAYARARRARQARRSPREVFTEVYAKRLWGTAEGGDVSSGSGSRGETAAAYVEEVQRFILHHKVSEVADLGCGDFFIGRQIAEVCASYVGVDVVPALVARNTAMFGSERIRFECLDIVDDELPDAELCLVRQVLQHLSNAQIAKILPKLAKYRYVLVTEQYPADDKVSCHNLDKVHGADTRVSAGSAVYLDKPPFSLEGVRLLLEVATPASPDEVDDVRHSGFIRTYLIGSQRQPG